MGAWTYSVPSSPYIFQLWPLFFPQKGMIKCIIQSSALWDTGRISPYSSLSRPPTNRASVQLSALAYWVDTHVYQLQLLPFSISNSLNVAIGVSWGTLIGAIAVDDKREPAHLIVQLPYSPPALLICSLRCVTFVSQNIAAVPAWPYNHESDRTWLNDSSGHITFCPLLMGPSRIPETFFKKCIIFCPRWHGLDPGP